MQDAQSYAQFTSPPQRSSTCSTRPFSWNQANKERTETERERDREPRSENMIERRKRGMRKMC
eukprot:766591-Amorphochlora_amoeboformis.AAC.1